MYAVVMSGGKQHRVREGDLLRVEKLVGDVGSAVMLPDVLLVGGDAGPKIGTPRVEGAMVTAEIVSQTRGKKILVFKRKRRKNYRRMYGHRQAYTHIRINKIEVG